MHVDHQLFFAVDRYRTGRMGFERMWVSVETGFVRVICQIAADELDVSIVAQPSLPRIYSYWRLSYPSFCWSGKAGPAHRGVTFCQENRFVFVDLRVPQRPVAIGPRPFSSMLFQLQSVLGWLPRAQRGIMLLGYWDLLRGRGA